ncbi:MAG: hypothetical protein DI629_07810 [Mesorhizobium amorphae]|nr:MAG: hypothetical protein DI629_07810 [Mesorhizobium amorphae]
MPDTTPNLVLPFILPQQAQKHVTHNEAIRALDALMQVAVLDWHRASPPEAPGEGDRYVVGAEPTGAWRDRDGELAAWQDGAWAFFAPREGWLAWAVGEDRLIVRRGEAWEALELPASVNPVAMVGVNAEADAVNRLAVAAPATLLRHGGTGGHQLKIAKAAGGDTAAVLFQTAASGRAELGLLGSDHLGVKLSADGAAWKTALSLHNTTLQADFFGSQVVHAGPGRVSEHDPSGTAGHGGYRWSSFYQPGAWTNGPPGDVSYVDDVWASGINMAGVSVRADASRQYAAWHMESKFYQGPAQNSPYTENFLHVIDQTGAAHRPIAWVGRHDGSFGEVAFSATVVNWYDYANRQIMKLDYASGPDGEWQIFDPLVFRYFTNDRPFWRQQNAGGDSSVALPFIDDGDNLVVEVPITGGHGAGSKNARGLVARARGSNSDALTAEAPGAQAATLAIACGRTQGASGAIAVAADGSTHVSAASGAVTEADIGRLVSGAGVPAGTRVADVASATAFSTTQALPASVSSVTLGARARRSAELSVDGNGAATLDLPGTFAFRDKANNHAAHVLFDFGNNRLDLTEGFLLRFARNNAPALRQANGAGTAHLALPYLDERDQLVVDPAITGVQVAGSKNARGVVVRTRGGNTDALTAEAPGGLAATLSLACGANQAAGAAIPVVANGTTGVTAAAGAVGENDIGRLVSGANVPANTRIADVTGPGAFTTSNALPAGVSAITLGARSRRSFEFSVDHAGATTLDAPGTIALRDKSSSYAIALHYWNGKWGFGAGANYPTGAHAFDAPLRLKSYALAALPPANTAGAGAMVYVADASGGPHLACSDGSVWRSVGALGEQIG